jgi:sRNA-binding protein
MRKSSPEEIRAALALIEQLAERWPKCFSVFERRRRPLKLGVHLDLLDAGVAPAELLSLAMRLYTGNIFYLRSMVRTGAVRIDLDGMPAGSVSEHDALGAASLLERRAAGRERQVPAPATTPVPTVTPPAPTVAGPKRLTLAGLREAAQLRKQKALEQQSAEAS